MGDLGNICQRMRTKRRRFWLVSIGQALIWPVPLLLALMGHLYAFPKADLSGVGPGLHIALMNDRTIRAQHIGHVLSQHYWLFIIYGVALISTFVILKVKRISAAVQVIVL